MVQAAGVNALIALVGAAPASATNAASAQDANDDDGVGQQFSQLLSDSGKQYDEQQGGQAFLPGKLLQTAALGALSAQEVNDSKRGDLDSLLQAREQVISQSDAKELIGRIDKILAQDRAPASIQALTQLKDQLARIARSGEPKTIGEILQAAPAVKESKLSLLGLTALLSPRKPESHEGKSAQEEEASSEQAVLQLVPTAIFRPHSSDDAAAQTAPSEPKAKTHDELAAASDTITLITPLSAVSQAVVPLPITPTAGETSTKIAVNGIASAPLAPPVDIDARIPSLALVNDKADTLPEVSLPKWSAESAARKEQAAASFQALAAAAGVTAENAKQEQVLLDAKDRPIDAIPSLSNSSHANGFSPTQTVNAAQPVSVVPTHGYINHAPVTEQVHVAVRQAAKDGIEQITVQLDPIDLGRVEVNIQTNRDGQTQISFLVDKADTFDNLSRDARSLERSLQEAGIKADAGSMQFNLRQQPQPQLHSDLNGQGQHPQQEAQNDDAPGTTRSSIAAIDAATRNYIINVREGVDISA